MYLPNNVFKEESKNLELIQGTSTYNPDDNIHIAIYYLKSLYDNLNKYNVSITDRIKLTILTYEYNSILEVNSLLNSKEIKYSLNPDIDLFKEIKNITNDRILLEHITTVEKIMSEYRYLSEHDLKDDIDKSREVYINRLISMVSEYNKLYNKEVIL